jgi:hypothetical protein
MTFTPTHSMSNKPEYHAWESMRTRCHAGSGSVHYSTYASRGIKVCQEWEDSFEAFYSHIGPRPSSLHSIDRIDNDKGYEPGNVRWATRREQQRNTRRTKRLTINGETKPLGEWADIANLRMTVLYNRIRRHWPPSRLLEPSRKWGQYRCD